MSVYICEKCGCLENTATGPYWQNKLNNEPLICSECNTDEWHNKFPKKHWSEYGMQTLLKEEKKNNGNAINATDYFTKEGLL